MQQRKATVEQRARRPRVTPRRFVEEDEGQAGRGAGRGGGRGGGRGAGRVAARGAGRGRGGGRDAHMLLCDIPSASGDVASESMGDEESREDDVEMDDVSADEEVDEETEREMRPRQLRIRGEARVPEENEEPTNDDGKYLIVPGVKE